MKIIHITPGTGNFYCGNCIRDNSLVTALRSRGHDAVMVPMYLPMMTDTPAASENQPIYFGGINVYLQQKFKFFRKSPRWLDSLFDFVPLLRGVCELAHMTSPKDLGELTVSMLKGEEGKQDKEIGRLIDGVKRMGQPDVICLSNALLVGLARRFKKELKAPVVCTLQGEDTFLDSLSEPESSSAWETLVERANDIDAFIAVSNYFAGVMQKRLELPKEKICVIPNGIFLERYYPSTSLPNPPALGYLARLCPGKGLETLVEAFFILKTNKQNKDLKLRIAGTMTSGDKSFVKKIKKRIRQKGLDKDVIFLPNLTLEEKQAFFRTLTVFSVPATYGEAFGLYILEALASGVPVVQPKHAAFPEIVDATEGGIICKPDCPKALAESIDNLLSNSDKAKKMGERGRQAVMEKFSIDRMTDQVLKVFEKVTG